MNRDDLLNKISNLKAEKTKLKTDASAFETAVGSCISQLTSVGSEASSINEILGNSQDTSLTKVIGSSNIQITFKVNSAVSKIRSAKETEMSKVNAKLDEFDADIRFYESQLNGLDSDIK